MFGATGFDRSVEGLLGAGRDLADRFQAQLRAVVLGPCDAEYPSRLGHIADELIFVDQPELASYNADLYLAVLQKICAEPSERAVLFGNDTYSQELAPRLAFRLGGSAVGDVTGITVDYGLRVRRSVYGGKAEAIIALKRSPAVLWLRARAFAPATNANRLASTRHLTVVLPGTTTRLLERTSASAGAERLEDAKIVIGGGRGIGGPEPFTRLQELAALLGGQVAASRAACDAGWVPPSFQVGQTGKKIAPDLYLAVGIHGASQHMAGVSDAKLIAAINIDPDAPIFKYCSFGIVEDYRKVLPILQEKLSSGS
jgi:electron transfer flavoprotein alpha subunit